MMCQSIVNPERGPAPCQNAGSHHLLGFHLCGAHERYWRPRVAAGVKIRIHPERALAIGAACDLVELTTGEGMRRCTKCGEYKPVDAFYQKSRASGGGLMSECKVCFNRRSAARPHSAAPSPPPPAEPATPPPPIEPGPEPPLLRIVETDEEEHARRNREAARQLERDLASRPLASSGSIATVCPFCGARRADAQTGCCLGCRKRVLNPDLAREFGHPLYDRPTNGTAS